MLTCITIICNIKAYKEADWGQFALFLLDLVILAMIVTLFIPK